MRKIILAAFVSLDGVMQAPGGPEEDPTGGFAYGGWTFHYADETTGEVLGQTFSQPFDLLLGRKTYEIFAAYWPEMDDDPIGALFNGVTKYVATRGQEPLKWTGSVKLEGDVAQAIAALKETDGPDLLIQGSTGLIQTLLANDLIDEFRLMTFPLVLGNGKRLFGDGTVPTALTLSHSRTSATGVVMSTYTRGGDIRTGSYARETPSDAEIARQERMKREG